MSITIDRCDSCEIKTDPDDAATLDGAFWCARCWSEHYVMGTTADRLEALAARVAALPEFARQARTIRRLRALADGYRAKWRKHSEVLWSGYALVEDDTLTADALLLARKLRETVAKKERARIVAALRAKVCANTSPYWDREATALGIVADAIERGEL